MSKRRVVTILAVAMALGLGFAAGSMKQDEPSTQPTKMPAKAVARAYNQPRANKPKVLIKEWDVALKVPADLTSKLDYQFAGPFTDQQGVQIEQVKLLVLNLDGQDNVCEIVRKDGREYIFSATQLLRTPSGTFIDASRYRGEFRMNIFSNQTYNFHSNYLIPDCAGPATTQLIKRLQLKLQLQSA